MRWRGSGRTTVVAVDLSVRHPNTGRKKQPKRVIDKTLSSYDQTFVLYQE